MTSRKVILEASAGLQPGQAAKDAAAALARDDFDAAATALLAGAARGEAPPEDLVRRALPGVDDPVLACALMGRTQGDAVALAVAALEGGALTTVQESHLLLAAALCLKGAPPPPGLVSQARRAARRKWPDEDAPVFAAAAQVLALPELFVLQPGLKEESASKDARLCRDDVQAWLDGPLEKVLPEEPLLGPPLPGAKRAEKVPRNAPCPCGSGKKFKVCHGGADAGPAPAESTLEGRLKAASPELSPRHVDSLRVGELVHLDLPALQTPALLRAYDRLCWARRLELAEQVVDELLARGAVEASRADDYRLDLVLYGLEQDRPDVVDRQRAKLKEPTLFDALSQLERDWLGQDLPASRLEAAARLALESKDEALTVDLAWLLMRRAPALGVLAARGAMARARPHESQELLTGAEDARDRVLLPPVEPAWAVHDAAFPREQGEDAEAQRAALETRAAELAKRLEESQKRLTDAEGRLHAAQTPGGAATDDAERGRLAQKVTELKELLKEGNRERAELRRNMQHLSEQLATQPASAPAPATAEDAEEEGDGLDAPRGALVPVFERAAAAALEALPKNVARDAVLEVGEVAAGLPHAWREVKRMQHVPGYLSVRVGIHYRVIFHVDGSALRVDEVIHRQDLDATVRRLGR